MILRHPKIKGAFFMEVTYSIGPRYINGKNIDEDIKAEIPKVITEQGISDPVTDLGGKGYQPGQLNRDGTDL